MKRAAYSVLVVAVVLFLVPISAFAVGEGEFENIHGGGSSTGDTAQEVLPVDGVSAKGDLSLTDATSSESSDVSIPSGDGEGDTEPEKPVAPALTEEETKREALDALATANLNVLSDGSYVVHSLKNASFVVGSSSSSSGAIARIYSSGGLDTQRWIVSHDEKGYVSLLNAKSGLALDVCGARPAAGTSIQTYTPNTTWAQKWIAVADGSSIKLVSALDATFVLDCTGGYMASGTALQLYASNNTAAQRWIFEDTVKTRVSLDELAMQNSSALVEGRTYLLSSALSRKKVIDVAGGSINLSANVQLYSSNMTAAQQWVVSHDANGYVTFTNVKSGKVLDVSGGLPLSGTNVAQYSSNNTYAQKWIVVQDGESYKISSALGNDIVLDVFSASTADGTNMQIWSSNNSKAQRFYCIDTEVSVAPCEDFHLDGWYSIASLKDSSYVVDVSAGSMANAANAQMYSHNGTLAQLWKFVYIDGYYQIVNARSNKCLDVAGGNLVPGTNVAQWSSVANNRNQLFSLQKNTDGSYVFVNAATGLALDVAGGTPCVGANLQAYIANGSEAQSFVVNQVDNLLAEGLFEIKLSYDSSKALDVTSGSVNSGANIQTWTANGSTAQKWRVSLAEGQSNTYRLEALCSGMYLASNSSGNVIQAAGNEADDAQKWIPTINSGSMVLCNVATGKVLDVSGRSTAAGANVQTYSSNGTIAQRFNFVATSAVSNGCYFIQSSKVRGEVLDVSGGLRSDYANVQIYGNNDTGAQKWSISQNSDGTYTIVNAQSKKSLDVASGSTSSGTNVQQFRQNGTAAQKWRISYEGQGSFRIASVLDPSLVLDVAGDTVSNGANIQISADTGLPDQRFAFSQASYNPYTAIEQAMADRAQGYSSSTSWLILADTSACRVCVFRGWQGNWQLDQSFICSVGAWNTPTRTGIFTVGSKGYVFGHGYSCYYYTQFSGDYLFHSVKYYAGTYSIMDGRLGEHVSAGCVRLPIENAKWIYDYVPMGSRVVVY